MKHTCKAWDADCILDLTSSRSNNIFIDSEVFCSTYKEGHYIRLKTQKVLRKEFLHQCMCSYSFNIIFNKSHLLFQQCRLLPYHFNFSQNSEEIDKVTSKYLQNLFQSSIHCTTTLACCLMIACWFPPKFCWLPI